MQKASRTFRKAKKSGSNKSHWVVGLIVVLLGAVLFAQGSGYTMSVVNTVSGRWSGEISIAGFSEDGYTYLSQSSLPSVSSSVSWGTDSVTVDVDGPVRYYGYAGLGQQVINSDLPEPINVPNLDGYPTAKPKLTWTIMDNMRHIDVDNKNLQVGIPSVVTQENGYLVEVYYYTFSVKLDLVGSRAIEHDFYRFSVDGFPYGARYMYDLAPFHGLYLIPEVGLVSDNESIIDMGSDMATFGDTQWKFYRVTAPTTEIPSSVVEQEFKDNIAGLNRDFFLAGGDSGAGINVYNKVNEDTNQFSVGFVKVGTPAYIYGNSIDAAFNTMQTVSYNIELVIPLRLSVIITYDLPYTGADIYAAGEEGTDEQDFFRSFEEQVTEFADKNDLTLEQLGIIAIVVGVVLVIFIKKRG